ncbi:MAG: hypothetical protein STSR0008_22100 [Ignavibacterium sp.]
MKQNKVFNLIIFSILINFNSVLLAQYQGPIAQPTNGFGANGPFSVVTESFSSPLWLTQFVTVFRPKDKLSLSPVIFFCHGYSATDVDIYSLFLTHIASRGYIVVFSPYRITGDDNEDKYNTMFAGFEEAVARYKSFIDTTKIGFIGHSYGGGAVPALAFRALTDKGWGSNGCLLYMLAQWYSFQITQQQLQSFPSQTKLVVEVYYDDDINDHRMGKDIFENIGINISEKDFLIIYSDSSASLAYTLQADHFTPITSTHANGETDGLDYYGIWKIFDALAEYTFTGSSTAKETALGNGNPDQTFMGLWPSPENREVKRLNSSDSTVIDRPMNSFKWEWDNPINPRRDITDVHELTLPTLFKLYQNYPNPFNPTTTLSFVIGSTSGRSFVTLKVYDILGNEIATLVNEEKPAGTYEITFDASKLSSGVYFYRLKANGIDGSSRFVDVKKMTVLK